MKFMGISTALLLLAASPAFAQTAPSSYTLSAPLVEEIYQRLAAQPYSSVAATVAKLQAELQHQPVAAPVATLPAPKAPEIPQEPKK